MAQLNKTFRGRKENARDMLLAAGIGEYNAILSLPYMYFMPRTCDPYAQGVMQIVEGLQNMLRELGKDVTMSGFCDPQTGAAIACFSGSDWSDKTWLQIYGDVLRGQHAPGFEPHMQPISTDFDDAAADAQIPTGDLTGVVGGLMVNPFVWLAAGGAIFYFYGWKRPNPRRRRA